MFRHGKLLQRHGGEVTHLEGEKDEEVGEVEGEDLGGRGRSGHNLNRKITTKNH